MRLNFWYLKIIHILYPKIIGLILKNEQRKQVCLYSWDYTINYNENEDENEKYHTDTTQIDPALKMDTHVVNIHKLTWTQI